MTLNSGGGLSLAFLLEKSAISHARCHTQITYAKASTRQTSRSILLARSQDRAHCVDGNGLIG